MPKKILLVDDTMTVTAMERIILGDAYEYTEARNGKEAVERARAIKPDLILMDLNMPVRGGMDALGDLKADAATAHIPVVIVSTRSEAESVDGCRRLGCADFIFKPIDRERLRATVKRLLEGAT
jgi:CheY-like chemotaxis protein